MLSYVSMLGIRHLLLLYSFSEVLFIFTVNICTPHMPKSRRYRGSFCKRKSHVQKRWQSRTVNQWREIKSSKTLMIKAREPGLFTPWFAIVFSPVLLWEYSPPRTEEAFFNRTKCCRNGPSLSANLHIYRELRALNNELVQQFSTRGAFNPSSL